MISVYGYARVVDHLAIRNVAKGSALGGGPTLHPPPFLNHKNVFLILDNTENICQSVTKTTGHFTTLHHFVCIPSY